MKILFAFFTIVISLECFAVDSIQYLKNAPNLKGALIEYCTLGNKNCGKVDRSVKDFTLKQTLASFPNLMESLDSVKANFERLKVSYKISDFPGQDDSFKYSYERAKKLRTPFEK